MEKIFLFIVSSLTLYGCGQSNASSNSSDKLKSEYSKKAAVANHQANQTHDSISLQKFFTLSDAENILGEPAHLTDSTMTINKDVSKYSCAYTAKAKDQKSGKTGTIYFLIEQYVQDSSAKNRYAYIKTANENHGIKVLHDLGDEAYFHSDGQNFYFIMVRKRDRTFNMKVNKITSHTSLEQFNVIAINITAVL